MKKVTEIIFLQGSDKKIIRNPNPSQSGPRCYLFWSLHKNNPQKRDNYSNLQGLLLAYKKKLRHKWSFNYIPNLLRLDYAHSCKLHLCSTTASEKCSIHVILFVGQTFSTFKSQPISQFVLLLPEMKDIFIK